MNAAEETSPKKIHFGECNVCGEQHDTSQCPSLSIIQKVKDENIPSRARLTLPQNLKLTEVNGQVCIIAKERIPLGTQFGPLDAPKVARLNCQPRFPLKLFLKDSRYLYLNTTDETKCNWMCLVTPSKEENDQNLIAYQLHQDIFFSSQKEINEEDELIVGYAFAYGRKMAMSTESSSGDHDVNETSSNNDNSSAAPPPRKKRGRPPKSTKVLNSAQKEKQEKKSSAAAPSIDESIVQSLDAKQLGIIEEQQEWTCSQCGTVFVDCLKFAKHLQEHYKPSNYNKGRGRSRGRGRRKLMRKRNEKHIIDEDQVKGTTAPEVTIVQESAPSVMEQESSHSQQGDSGIDGDMEKDNNEIQAPNDDSSSEIISIPGTVSCATQTYSSRGRKRKCEILDKEEEEEDKKYEFVSREISQSASTKYNLRKTRKALVIPKEEIEQDGTDDDEEDYDDDDTDYEEDDDISHSGTAEHSIETPITDSTAVSNTLEPLSIAASKILSSLIGKQLQDDINEQQSNEINTQKTTETSDISQMKEKRIIHMSLVQANHYHSKQPGQYKCDLCGKGFSKTLYLFRHIRRHTGEFTCKRCRRVFARKENMLKHNCPGLADEKEEKELKHHCSYCNKAFETQKLLVCHMAKHTGEFTCEACGKSYSSKDSLTRHACPAKPANEQYVCGICRKCFTKETYLFNHLPVHTGQYACKICGKWLRSCDSLTNHMRMCGQVKEIEENGEAKCPNCHKVFTNVAEFRRHQYEHTHLHMCDTCGARFRNLMALRLHVCHGKEINCEVCGKIFTSISHLQEHKLAHGDPQYKCKECGKEFHTKDALMKHPCEWEKQGLPVPNKKKPVNLMPLACEKCGSVFSSTSSLKVHRILHGEKKFSCEYCGKKFHRKDLLLEHHAVHGSPKFPCSVCQKLFKTKKSLDVHVMIHDGIKRFKCETCGKEFFQKGNLQKHEETHESDRKYLCTICQKNFSRKQYYKHMLEHTTGRIYSCGICGRSFVKEHQLRSHHRMFHSNRVYSCSYCNLTLKLCYSLKRHLRKKHADFEDEWKNPEFLNSMLTTKEQVEHSADKNAESYFTSNTTPNQGTEVFLALTGLGTQEWSEAIASGRAQIKQGSAPDTLEISLPFPIQQDNEENTGEQIILTAEETNNVQNSEIDKSLQYPVQVMCSVGKEYHITMQANEIDTTEGREYQITLPVAEQMAAENHQCEVAIQDLSSAEGEYEISLQPENQNEEHLRVDVLDDCTNPTATEREHYQMLSDISTHVKAQYEEMQPDEIVLGKQYQVKQPASQDMNEAEAEQYQVMIPESQGTTETEGYQITLSEEQTNTDLVAETEDGQQIVISGQGLPDGTHHIVFDAGNIQQIAEGGVIESQDTIVLQEGTILQQSGEDVLLYVLTNEQAQ